VCVPTAFGLGLAKSLERLDALEPELDVALRLLLIGELAQAGLLVVPQDVQRLGFICEDQPQWRVRCSVMIVVVMMCGHREE